MSEDELPSLLRKACEGDRAAFELLCALVRERLLPEIRRASPPWMDPEEILTDTLVRIWKSLKRLRNGAKVLAYARVIVRHLIEKEARKHLGAPGSLDAEPCFENGALENPVAEELLDVCRAELTRGEADFFALKYVEGFSNAQIAKRLRISLPAARAIASAEQEAARGDAPLREGLPLIP